MMISTNSLKRSLEKKLRRRGRISTINNKTLKGPKREFKTISEEIIWALNESGSPLSVDELSHYLDINRKSVQKSLRKIKQYPLGDKLVSRKKNGGFFVYNMNIDKDSHIPTVFHMIKIS